MLEVWASAQPLSLTPDTVAVGRVWLVSDAAFASFGHGLQLRRQDSLTTRRNGGMLAKHSAVPRCRASYFDGNFKQSRNAKKTSSVSGEFAQESNAPCGHLVGEGINLPNSLRVLKRQQQQRRKDPAETSSEGLVGCSMKKAFSSMVYMLKSMQSYTLQMRQLLFCEDQFQEMWSFVQRETHASFLWLFQQVFACTPKLMISVMILLANFTVYSMDSSLAMGSMLPTVESPASSVSCLVDSGMDASFVGLSAELTVDDAVPLLTGNNNNGSRGGKSVLVAGGMDGGDGLVGGCHHSRTMYSQEESAAEAHASAAEIVVVHPESLQAAGMNSTQAGKAPLLLDAHHQKSSSSDGGFDEEVSRQQQQQHMERSDELIFKFLLQEATKEHEIALQLDTKQALVAPVTAKLEPDNYECYDRTDLLYQHALSLDAANPLLLANYAQFLHVVRHDHDRAENFFRRATGVDPSDGEVMSRFACFLWLARGDQSGAEAAFKDAIASDPSNPFYAGSYAHFLWHAGEEEAAPFAAPKPAIVGTTDS